MATSRSSVILKRLRQRFGIRAPKMTVKLHVAWHWRALQWILILSISFAFSAWIFETGRKITGFDDSDLKEELSALKKQMHTQEEELSKLQSQADTGESSLQIERSTLKKLTEQVRGLEQENIALKEDLAFFERMIPAQSDRNNNGVRIDQFNIDAVAGSPNEYHYRMLIVNGSDKKTPDFRGNYQLSLQTSQGLKDAMILVPAASERDTQKFKLDVKYFRRIEGVFSIPAGSVLKTVEVRLLQEGAVRTKQMIKL